MEKERSVIERKIFMNILLCNCSKIKKNGEIEIISGVPEQCIFRGSVLLNKNKNEYKCFKVCGCMIHFPDNCKGKYRIIKNISELDFTPHCFEKKS